MAGSYCYSFVGGAESGVVDRLRQQPPSDFPAPPVIEGVQRSARFLNFEPAHHHHREKRTRYRERFREDIPAIGGVTTSGKPDPM